MDFWFASFLLILFSSLFISPSRLKELFGYVTYENRSRAPGMKSETLEYEPADDDDGYFLFLYLFAPFFLSFFFVLSVSRLLFITFTNNYINDNRGAPQTI